jgi:hypothetical protein
MGDTHHQKDPLRLSVAGCGDIHVDMIDIGHAITVVREEER